MHRYKWKVSLSILSCLCFYALAQCTVIPYHVYTHFHKKLNMHTSTITINGFGDSIVKPLGISFHQ